MASEGVASPRSARAKAARSPSPAGRAAKPVKGKSTVVAPKGKGKSFGFFGRHGNVYLYIPNLIGAMGELHGRRGGENAHRTSSPTPRALRVDGIRGVLTPFLVNSQGTSASLRLRAPSPSLSTT